MPAQRDIAIVRDGFVGAGAESGRKRLRDFPLERIAGDIAHLGLDRVETLPFALSDFDGQQLQQMPVSVGRTGAGSLGPVEQVRSLRKIEPLARSAPLAPNALVGRTPAASTRAVAWAASPRAFQGAWRAWARRRATGDSAMWIG